MILGFGISAMRRREFMSLVGGERMRRLGGGNAIA
jgi:hypothetical protein